MRLLVHAGFFKLEEEANYSLTPASELLILRDDDSLQAPPAHLFLQGDDDAYWSFLSAWFRRSDEATLMEVSHDLSIWEATEKEAKHKQGFYDIMAGDSKLVARVMVSDYCKHVFNGLGSLVDVGGGTGIMSVAIAKAFPNINCTVLDLPHVNPQDQEADYGLPNLEFVGGDMFQEIPPADAILLKWVLHNWDDENCVKILKKCREAVSHDKNNKGKVIMIDMVVGHQDNQDFFQVQLCFDLLMTTLLHGKERTESEFSKLFMAAGFSGYKIIRDIGPRSVIEAYP